MSVKPKIISFLIADMVIQEGKTNKWSAIGIFETIAVKKFPILHSSLGLYIRLSDAEGKYDVRVEFCGSNARKLAVFKGISISVPSKLMTPDFAIQTRQLPILGPGKYNFDLYFNDELVQSFPLMVVQASK